MDKPISNFNFKFIKLMKFSTFPFHSSAEEAELSLKYLKRNSVPKYNRKTYQEMGVEGTSSDFSTGGKCKFFYLFLCLSLNINRLIVSSVFAKSHDFSIPIRKENKFCFLVFLFFFWKTIRRKLLVLYLMICLPAIFDVVEGRGVRWENSRMGIFRCGSARISWIVKIRNLVKSF